jgi:hypothetical protein
VAEARIGHLGYFAPMPQNTGWPAGACHRAARRADRWRAMTVGDAHPRSRGAMRPGCAAIVCQSFARKNRGRGATLKRGRGECRVPAAPAAPCAMVEVAHERRHHRFTGTPGIPARNGFNGLFRALPGDEFVLSPSSANERHAQARSGRHAFANLTPATGARTTRLHRPQPPVFAKRLRRALAPFVHAPVDCSRALARPAIPSRDDAAASTASHPNVRDDRDTPLVGDETAEDMG